MQMAQTTGGWTLEELHRLPDDGNKYELVRGELFVTPPPSFRHETLASVLESILVPYVKSWGLGRIYRPRSVVRLGGSEVEPDLVVRPPTPTLPEKWEDAALPILVVEILSDSTRRRDHGPKREWYLDIGIPDYWIVDGEKRTIRRVRPGMGDVVTGDVLVWHPPGAGEPLVVDIPAFFQEALG